MWIKPFCCLSETQCGLSPSFRIFMGLAELLWLFRAINTGDAACPADFCDA